MFRSSSTLCGRRGFATPRRVCVAGPACIAIVGTLVVVTSCSEQSRESDPVEEPTAPPYVPPDSPTPNVGGRAEHQGQGSPRFRISRGQLEVGRPTFGEAAAAPTSTLDRGDAVPPGRRIRATERTVALDGPQDVRVELEPSSSGFVLEESPLGFALLSGSVIAAVPPRGGTTLAPLRVATPAATVVIAGAGEAFVSIVGPGSVWVSAVSGRLRWGGPSATERPSEIVAGQSVLLTIGGEADIRPGPASIDEARRASPRPRANRDGETVRGWLVEAVRDLDAAILESTEVSEAGAALTKALRERDDDGPTAADLRRQAVVHGQRRLSIRERLVMEWEHALVLASQQDAERALLSERRLRVRSWLER